MNRTAYIQLNWMVDKYLINELNGLYWMKLNRGQLLNWWWLLTWISYVIAVAVYNSIEWNVNGLDINYSNLCLNNAKQTKMLLHLPKLPEHLQQHKVRDKYSSPAFLCYLVAEGEYGYNKIVCSSKTKFCWWFWRVVTRNWDKEIWQCLTVLDMKKQWPAIYMSHNYITKTYSDIKVNDFDIDDTFDILMNIIKSLFTKDMDEVMFIAYDKFKLFNKRPSNMNLVDFINAFEKLYNNIKKWYGVNYRSASVQIANEYRYFWG